MIPLNERVKLVERKSERLSISAQCQLLSFARSTFYHAPSMVSQKDLLIMGHLGELHLEDPTRGTRRMSNELALLAIECGRSKVRRLMNIMRMNVVYRRPRTTIADPRAYKYPYLLRGLKIDHSDQVWQVDITYIPMAKGFMYLCAIIDVYSRYIVGWSISNTMPAEWVVSTVKDAIDTHGPPQIINSDQGSQFTSELYVTYIKSLETVRISMDGKGRALDNVFIERFWRTIKYDKLHLTIPTDGVHLHQLCTEFIEYYNQRRGHSAHNYLRPAQVYSNAA